nr:MAG TPA: YopX protein [Caudoviricetes sp.]
MRPKFRAWIKEEKCFADYIESIRFYINEIDLCWGGICESDCFDFKGIIFTQSTGLFDKNNKEIFEGDIVLVLDSPYTVFYDNEKGSYRLKPHDDRWNVDYMSNFSHGGNFEIIGNIYENPELLEDSK